jgi:hypothetical protein
LSVGKKQIDPRKLIELPEQENESLFFQEKESVFFIPAQRVMTMQNGWPRMFHEFSHFDPFVVRSFSERIWIFVRAYDLAAEGSNLFPKGEITEQVILKVLNEAIFHGAELLFELEGPQWKMMLKINGTKLPFMVWSAGQREFVPLLLGVYSLLPTHIKMQEGIKWVIIEEPEMGLHPRAIYSVMLLILDMLHQGYRVILSTHSNDVLDVVWAIQEIKMQNASPDLVSELFNCPGDADLRRLAKAILAKTFKVFAFYRDGVQVRSKDISMLDPGSDDKLESGWGGLSEYSGHAGDIVGKANRNI